MADEPMSDEPMSDERLAEIRRMVSRAEASMMASSDVALRDLLAEVERLQAENQRLAEERERWAITATNGYETVADRSAKLAAAMAIVRAVAQNDMVIPLHGSARCVFWDCEYDGISDHSSNCPWRKARALLA